MVLARPSKLYSYADKLSVMLRIETGKSRKQKHTIKKLHADLMRLGASDCCSACNFGSDPLSMTIRALR